MFFLELQTLLLTRYHFSAVHVYIQNIFFCVCVIFYIPYDLGHSLMVSKDIQLATESRYEIAHIDF